MTAFVAQLVEHWMHYPKVVGLVAVEGRCVFFVQFNSFLFYNYCATNYNNFPYAFLAFTTLLLNDHLFNNYCATLIHLMLSLASAGYL